MKKLKRVGFYEKFQAKAQAPITVTPEEEICQWITSSAASRTVGTGGAIV